ncbi:MAG: ABC transporter ATP-binding protein/permease [Bacilli bacterium]|nr:ABC transporter ATP-binding protein/permease [bacterium]MDY2697396.1 ABC transporter ATP-binding protein/permease [Bacilli bacterium]
MLEIKNISKSYVTGTFTQKALDNFSLKFRREEFVSILGQSGSGKTTLLNIIGGLDKYDEGDLIINDKSTKSFKEKDWDAYRNNCIGFIFQNYNLITHISILENIEMGMTLSGVGSKEKREKALEALKKVGLEEHAHKKPNQLSGGQMQRVAIARALATDPDIILADEPTGALDSKTSQQIMKLIKEISKDKLVIMVTHNRQLAEEYSTRIVELKDGKLISDSNPIKKVEKDAETFSIRKTAMSFLTALKLSFNNIKTKKGRTALTAFASSIGIIGIALILSLSNGFKIEIDNFEKDSLSEAPIIISQQSMKLDEETILKMQDQHQSAEKYPDSKKVYVLDDVMESMTHTNVITKEYIDYIKKIDKETVSGISYQKSTGLNIINQSKDGYNLVNNTIMGMSTWTLLPSKMNNKDSGVVENNYDILAGKIDESEPGLILQLDSRNQIYSSTLKQLGLSGEEVSFDDILNKELKVIPNDIYYNQHGEYFIPNTDYESLYNNEKSITIKVQAIIRGKKEKEVLTSTTGIAYTNALVDLVIKNNKDSAIVKDQQDKDYNILTKEPFDETSLTNTKETVLGYLGAESVPVAVYIYPNSFESKDSITTYLDKYNEGKEEPDEIRYVDMASMISALSGNIMDAITIVLIAFSSISLVVSSIMIGIITYISVLERTKEIGILRALGARKKDIKRVFNAETFIIGIFSGILGIAIARILIIPTNIIIENASQLSNVAKLNPIHAIILITVSVTLTILGGLIPASMASKKNPVEALRTE